MSEETPARWEDIFEPAPPLPEGAIELGFAPSVTTGDLAVSLWMTCDVVDWLGRGARDLLVSCWEGCYEGGVYLFLQDGSHPDGTPRLQPGRKLEHLSGFVTAARRSDGCFDLIAASRRLPAPYLFRNVGDLGRPAFAASVPLEAGGPINLGKIVTKAMLFDVDGDGRRDLVIGTDHWKDHWPDGKEWTREGYRPYDEQGRWRGGPIRGHVYWCRNLGTDDAPRYAAPEPLCAGDGLLEVYGTATPAFADFRGAGRVDLICGDFLDRLHFLPHREGVAFGPASPVKLADGAELVMPQCIHYCTAFDWDHDGRPDLLVGAEDGHVYFVRNLGRALDGVPTFAPPVRVQQNQPRLHGGVCAVPAACDWNGDGLPDLIVGNAAGHLLLFEAASVDEQGMPRFLPPRRLEVEGVEVRIQAGENGSIQGPSERKWGYTNPTVADWDDDGLPDILISDVFGYHTLFRNVGAPGRPKLAPPRRLTYQGRDLKTVWRVRPAVVNWGAGLSYVCLDEEGVLSSYRKAGALELAEKAWLTYEDGAPIRFTEEFGGGRGRMKLCACDWTGSPSGPRGGPSGSQRGGLPDLLVGTHKNASMPPGPSGIPRHDIQQATVILLENVGRPGRPVFAPPRYVKHQGQPMKFAIHSCAPEAVDWRGRGAPLWGPVGTPNGVPEGLDLIVGVESGRLLYFPREELEW